jgi:FkbM family methyltransferase
MPATPQAMTQFECRNGLRVWNAPEAGRETRFIFHEIFARRCYEQHGVSIADGDVILDVGANVGLFALSAMERFRRLRIVCVEPVPNTRACLLRNVAECASRTDHQVAVVAAAIGAAPGEATIAYFRRAPGNSTLDPAEKRREWQRLMEAITPQHIWTANRLLAVLTLPLYPIRRRLFSRFVAPVLDDVEHVQCQVRTLSDTIREQGLERVDLLKVDVEGAEFDVLEGIEEHHWPRIRQIAMEIAPGNTAGIPRIENRLRGLGFRDVKSVRTESSGLEGVTSRMLFAVRSANRFRAGERGAFSHRHHNRHLDSCKQMGSTNDQT